MASFAQLLEVNQSDTVRVEVIKKKKTKQRRVRHNSLKNKILKLRVECEGSSRAKALLKQK